MEILNDGTTAQVEEVLALATVAGATALPVADMRQGVLDGDPLAELGAPSWRVLALAQLGQEAFIGMEADAAPPRTGGTALRKGQAAQVAAGKWTVPPAQTAARPGQDSGCAGAPNRG